tara:strand:- start:120 stop:368 length:249 start_codon:yes stop_codon:yes gene_type:complete
MKDNTDRTKEMTIYQSECGINTVDVFHFIEVQVKTINSQNRVIELLDEKAKLKEELRIEHADREEHFQQLHNDSCSSCGASI